MAFTELVSENVPTAFVLGATFTLSVILLGVRLSRTYVARAPIAGPTTTPFFGNALSLKEHDGFLDQLVGWAKQHGPVFSLYLGRKQCLVVSGMDAVREVTVKRGNDFGDRAESTPFMDINPKRLGIFDTRADETWKNQRKFAHTTLRGMGFGKVSLEPLIQKEVNHVIEYFKTKQEVPINPRDGFGITSHNVICQLLFNHRVDHGSTSGNVLMEHIRDLMVANEGVLLTFLPALWPVLRFTEKWRRLRSSYLTISTFFHDEIRVRQQRIDSCQGEPEVTDFLEAYLVHRRSDPEKYTLEALDFVLLDLILAGTDTVSTTMTWAVVYLVAHPDIQQRIHDEIVKEIGFDQVSLSHRSGLPYTQAALLEVQRLATVAPLVPRMATVDTTLGEKKVPKGTELLLNMWSLHQDPEVWPEPKRFKPERFLESDGALVKHPQNFLPFSAGKRVCMGDQLAKTELFIFFTSCLQQLKFSPSPGDEAPSFDGLYDLVRGPKPFNVLISPWKD